MKQYIIKKIVYANSIAHVEELVRGGETVFIELQDDIKSPEDMGFVKENGKGKPLV